MKFILLSSIRGKNDSVNDANKKIIETLEAQGHKIYHEHITKMSQVQMDSLGPDQELKFHKNVLDTLKKSDIVIVECSYQSLSLGYLISYALELNKPILLFYHESAQKPNLFPTLNFSDLILVSKYKDVRELSDLIKEYVEYASDKIDVRFNFFISPSIGTYLDWVSKNKKIPRSVYLRNLIEKEMNNNDEYNT